MGAGTLEVGRAAGVDGHWSAALARLQGKESELEELLTSAQPLGEHPELFAQPPNIEPVDVLASK